MFVEVDEPGLVQQVINPLYGSRVDLDTIYAFALLVSAQAEQEGCVPEAILKYIGRSGLNEPGYFVTIVPTVQPGVHNGVDPLGFRQFGHR